MSEEKQRNIVGEKFGRWTVIGDCIQISGRRDRKWLCRCDCGTERYVLERSLLYGGSQSCGCASVENRQKAASYNLEGKSFGDLSVVCKAENHPKDTRSGIWWTCRCTCGKECDVLASLLVTGKKTHCGCKTQPKNYYYKDISGQKFNRLTALYPTAKRSSRGQVIWHCRCDCGNELEVSYNELVYSNLQSCGCQKKEHNQMLSSFLTCVDGTSVDMIRSKKLPSDNISGVKGVYFSRGKWNAKIVFQQKQYYLGKYNTIEDAAKARKEAEELLFDGAVTHYERWKAKADSDPEWAAENPIEILVAKKSASELDVVFLPVIA